MKMLDEDKRASRAKSEELLALQRLKESRESFDQHTENVFDVIKALEKENEALRHRARKPKRGSPDYRHEHRLHDGGHGPARRHRQLQPDALPFGHSVVP
jgi:hypothetical protein